MLCSEPVAVVVLLRDDAVVTSWPVEVDGCPDLAIVDELARTQLAAQRMGMRIVLREPRADLVELLEVVGLLCVLGDLPDEVP